MAEAQQGSVVSVRGSVVDVRFDGHLPPIYSVLRAGADQQIVIEALAQRDAQHVRGIALTPTQGLARGRTVEDTGGPLKVPVGKGSLPRMFDVFGNALDREGEVTSVPSRRGYQPTLGTELSRLQERIANTDTGAIMSMKAVYVPADDFSGRAAVHTANSTAASAAGLDRPDVGGCSASKATVTL